MMNPYKEWLDLDTETIEDKPLTDIQKQSVKRHVLKHPKKRYSPAKKWLLTSIAGIAIFTTGFSALPAVASQVPFVENILLWFGKDDLPQTYDSVATVIDDVQSSSGIDMMIQSAVYDGTNIIVTYALKTDQDLGNQPMIYQRPDIKHSIGYGATGKLEKKNDNLYIGVDTITPFFEKEKPQKIEVSWKPESFTNTNTNKTFKGEWAFNFELDSVSSDKQSLKAVSADKDAKVTITSLAKSKLDSVINYEFELADTVMKNFPQSSIHLIEARDNLGRVYRIQDNGGAVTNEGKSLHWTASIYNLNPEATSLTITPEIAFSNGSGHIGKNNIKKMKPITVQLKR